jgi:ribonuclease HII
MAIDESLERERLRALFTTERELWGNGCRFIAGVDEAGRGPLAGPVTAAAVVFPQETFIAGLNDSKLLSPQRREQLSMVIYQQAISVAVGQASPEEIDCLNILQASLLAMQRAVNALRVRPDYLLVDGIYEIPGVGCSQIAIIKGDRRSASVAAASIIAKVHRDRLMQDYHRLYPQYQFDRHKGYPTKAHVAALEKYGYCEIHRRSFKPKGMLAAFEENRGR